MSASPETRPSLLVRLKDPADDEAWIEFTEIYRPLVCRLAARRGLQHADAEDLAQQVLSSVARAIDRWQTDPARARFRTWLCRVAGNAIVNALARARERWRDKASHGTRYLRRAAAEWRQGATRSSAIANRV